MSKGCLSNSASVRAATCSERRASSENGSCGSRSSALKEKAAAVGEETNDIVPWSCRSDDGSTYEEEIQATREVLPSAVAYGN
jgi:hypothetical protein